MRRGSLGPHGTDQAVLDANAAALESLFTVVERKVGAERPARSRLQRLAAAVARRLGLRGTAVQTIETAAMLHDVGKVAIPEAVLRKSGRLTETEFAMLSKHPEVGEAILSAIHFSPAVCEIVRHHHERVDGGGYPDGLAEEAIPLGARVLAAIDAYDALVADRPYRRALSAEQALAVLADEAGAAFDPEVVRGLTAVLREADEVPTDLAEAHDLFEVGAAREELTDLSHVIAVTEQTARQVDDPFPWELSLEGLSARRSALVRELVDVLQGGEEAVRRQAARVLGARGGSEAVPALIGALGDPAEVVRREAIWGLAEIATDEAVSAILEAAEVGDRPLACAAVMAAARLDDPRIPQTLAALAGSDRALVSELAAMVLGWFAGQSGTGLLGQDSFDPGGPRAPAPAERRGGPDQYLP
jgi:putative nucleotidyltransferase with HDIG domain